MARGMWEDFTSKYGFMDGMTVEGRDFRARDWLVEEINKLVGKAVVKIYDRPGFHNPCMILGAPEIPDEILQHLRALIEEAYGQAEEAPEVGQKPHF